MSALPLLFAPISPGPSLGLIALIRLVPAVTIALFVHASASHHGVPHQLAWTMATLLAGVGDALGFGSLAVLGCYLVVTERDDRAGPVRQWLIHRGRD